MERLLIRRVSAILLLGVVMPCFALAQSPDFERDVRPILERHCVECHRPGEVAPMSLRGWEETRPWAKSIRRVVAARQMPPWFADPAVGEFRNDRRLQEDEIATLVAWVESGAPQGETRPTVDDDAASTEAWAIGEPDLVVTMPTPYPVPAEGVVDYVNIKLATGTTQDRWVDAVEVRPGERSVIHHIDVLVCRPGCPEDADLAGLEPGVPSFFPTSSATEAPEPTRRAGISGDEVEFLASYLPGGRPQLLPLGYARFLPAGAELVLNIHYTPNGTAVADTSQVGFRFAPEPPTRRVVSLFLDNYSLWVPAGDPDYTIDTEATLATEATLLSMTPHMHSRGVAAEVETSADGGRAEPLLRVPRYDFNWQIDYELARPRELSRGDEIRYRLRFDNSPGNLANPDPGRDVPWGRQTTDEMSSLFVTLAVPPDVPPSQLFVRD